MWSCFLHFQSYFGVTPIFLWLQSLSSLKISAVVCWWWYLAGIESALCWYAIWLQGGYWQVRWIQGTHMGTPKSNSSTIHSLSLPGRASVTPTRGNAPKSGHKRVKCQSKDSKCFSECPATQVGLVGGVPTELQHHYLGWCNHHRLGALTIYFTHCPFD